MKLAPFFAGLSLVVLASGSINADDTAGIIRRAKSATAMMVLPDNRAGTAFCIDPSGIFVTNFDSAQRFGTLVAGGKIIIHAADKDQRVVGAKVIRADAASGLALLQADSKEPFPSLEIGDSEQLVETMPVIAVGYEGSEIHVEDDYPIIRVCTALIRLLHKKKGVLKYIQLDTQSNGTGAGGPMIGADGKVVGIMQDTTSMGHAIPSERLLSLMARPIISFSTPALTEAESQTTRKFTIGVTWLKKPQGRPTVVFLLNPGDKVQRSVEAKLVKDDVYEVSVAPMEERGPQLHIAAQFSEGNMEAEVADQDIQVGAATIRLSKVLAVDAEGTDGLVKAVVGDKTITGKLLGLEKVATTLGGATTTLDLTKATRFTVKPIDRSHAGVHYKITVNVNGVAMEDSDGTIPIEAAPTTAPAPGDRDFVFLSALQETSVTGLYTEFGWGLGKDSLKPGPKQPVTIDGARYTHALGFNPHGNNSVHITYDLGGRYRRFTGGVGISDSAGPFPSTLTFRILADGKELWRSHPFREAKVVDKFDVSVSKAQTLELETTCAGPDNINAHCLWVEPRLEAK